MRTTANALLHVNGGSVYAPEGMMLGLGTVYVWLQHLNWYSKVRPGFDSAKTLNGESYQFLKLTSPGGYIPLEGTRDRGCFFGMRFEGRVSKWRNIKGLGDNTPK